MRNLKPVVYMSTEDYNPQQTTQGYHILKFETSRGEYLAVNGPLFFFGRLNC
jgi:hypothetical protein